MELVVVQTKELTEEDKVKQHIRDCLLNLINSKLEKPPVISNKEAVFSDISKNYPDILFYTFTNTRENDEVLLLEQQIVICLCSIYALHDGTLEFYNNNSNFSLSPQNSYSHMLTMWREITAFTYQHKELFKNKICDEYYLSNLYLNNIHQAIIDTAELIANRVNRINNDANNSITKEIFLKTPMPSIDDDGNVFDIPAVLDSIGDIAA